jgi:peptide/nickel transport system permease protein
MARYLGLRALQLLPVLVGITFLTFLLLHLVPGDPAQTMLGVRATPHEVAVLRHEWGLDRPLPVQYWRYLVRLIHGNLGSSVYYETPTRTLIGTALPVTLAMLGLGALFAIVLAIPLAVLAATRRGRLADHVVRVVPLLGLGMPPFWVGFMLLILLSLKVHLFPAGGYGSSVGEHLRSLILPALTVAAVMTPILVRALRVAMIDVLESDFITAARAKGLSSTRVLVRHALRNTSIPAVSVIAVNLGYLLGGSVVIEDVFGLPGVGHLLLTGIFNRDFDVVQSVTLVYAGVVVLITLSADLLYAALDPRVVLGE